MKMLVVLSCMCLSFGLQYGSAVAAATEPTTLLITEIQTGTLLSAYDEYVEITNTSSEPVDVTGWTVIYTAASDLTDRNIATLDGVVEPGAFIVFAQAGSAISVPYTTMKYTQGITDAGGHIKLYSPADDGESEADRVGWGTAINAKANPATAPGRAASIKRCSHQGQYVNTDDNSKDFIVHNPSVGTMGPACSDMTPEEPLEEIPIDPEESNNPSPTPTDPVESPVVTPNCQGLIITEILPNPTGVDTGREFIEIYNSAVESLSLSGCSIALSGSSKRFLLPDSVSLEPGAYLALYDTETGLTLPNAAGGTLQIIQGDTEVYSVSYPSNMPDGVSWSLVDGVWVEAASPSPEQENVVVHTQPHITATPKAIVALQPCEEGKIRNPLTNRCKSPEVKATLVACLAGQVRNPETNRCRSVQTTTDKTLVPCQPNQVRNPDTNRCRLAVTETASSETCPEGKERNPETNRCRNIPQVLGSRSIDESADSKRENPAIIVITLAAVSGYSLFEYRDDALLWLRKMRKKPILQS